MGSPVPADDLPSSVVPADDLPSAVSAPTAAAPPADTSFAGWLKKTGGDLMNNTVRAGVKAVTALPLMAEDFGVAARDLYEGKDKSGNYPYELPSNVVNRALDSVTTAPTSTAGQVGEFASSAMLGAGIAPTMPTKVPSNFVPSSTVAQRTLNQTQDAGYVFPPSTTNPTVSNKILESFGGKVATQQDASIANMPTTNALARRAVGLPPDADITPDALSAIRTTAAKAKTALIEKAGPAVNMDQTYADNITQITQPYRDAAAELGDRFGNPSLVKAADAINQPQITPKVAMTAVDSLRNDADVAFRSGDKITGGAYKALATNIEDAVDRHLVAQGDTNVVDDYRAARQLQAKTYDVQKSLNDSTGNVNAGYFGSKLKRGGYLADDLFTIGQASRMAPKATQEISDSGSVRNTDVALGMVGAVMKHEPMFLLYPFARQGARAAMLSDAGQTLANPGATYAGSPGLAGLSQSVLAQWDLAK